MQQKSKYGIFSIIIILITIFPTHAADSSVNPKILHVLNRLSFGISPGDIEKVQAMGVDNYIKQQLTPKTITESSKLTQKLSQLESLKFSTQKLVQEYGLTRGRNEKKTEQDLKNQQKTANKVLEEATEARLLRAIYSQRQLEEVMVDFWYNHFNVFSNKGRTKLLVGAYERDAIRPHALGNFRDLLEATARHPGMLFYLDNWQNTGPSSPGARGRFKGLNENYARELMELHTLGVDGGYTQQDIISLAKIFTGWGIARGSKQGDNSGFYFDSDRHDFSDKVFLGKKIKGSGEAEAEEALDILSKSPATAKHISYKLAQYFVNDNPSPELVKRLQKSFLQSNGNIRNVLETLFQSPEFLDSKNYNQKFKTPYQYIISSLRATGIEITETKPLAGILQQLGMPIYGCQTPDGYKNIQAAWLNPDGMTRRLSFATALANGRIIKNSNNLINSSKDTQTNNQNSSLIKTETNRLIDYQQLIINLGNPFSQKIQQAINSSPPKMRPALILGSPEFMYK
jgi:uncharacterized protein (DUF1800 family)